MKKKNSLFFTAAIFAFATRLLAQSNCNLINSASFSVQNQLYLGGPTYAGLANGNWEEWIDCQVPLNNWIYVAYTKDVSNNSKLYFNGTLIKASSYQNLPFSWNSLRLGTDLPSSVNSFFNGKLDDLRISNVARTPMEISQHFLIGQAFAEDSNTIGLYNFDQPSGNSIGAASGPSGQGFNTTFTNGVFGNCIEFNGTNSYADFQLDIPESNLTIEFWMNINNISGFSDWVINYPGIYGAGFEIGTYSPNYTWSTGDTVTSITVDPTEHPFIWVTDGNCTDTIWFESQSETIYDTTYITVTDTLIINTNITGINPPNNSNTIKVFPNPTSDHITIDYGNYGLMNGYQLTIENSLGQQVFQTNINQQTDYLSLDTWGGNGLYFVHIIDAQGYTIDIRKIVLQ